jgi:hypothetical protein
MNAYVGVTDRDWFDFLSTQEHVDEVNFWQPNPWGGEFRVVRRGEFKKADLDARQELYQRLAEWIWSPERLAREAAS